MSPTKKSQLASDVREPREPRVLFWDIETSPNQVRTWGAYEQNALWIDQHWHFLTIAWKWSDEKKVHVAGLDDYVGYEKDPENDYPLALLAWELYNEADIVVAHNGIAFDTKKAKARMIVHELPPCKPVVEVDTMMLARKNFAFTTNRLNDICEFRGIGNKVNTGGIELWKDIVLNHDPKAWAKMKKYNKHDVVLLEALYYRLRPWAKQHPNLATIADRPKACPKCLSEEGMVIRGYRHTAVSVRANYCCKGCGGYSQGRKILKSETEYVV